MAMTARDKMLAKWIVALLPLGLVVFYFMNIRTNQQTAIESAQHAVDSLQAAVDSARADLASGTVESLRQRVDDYQASLSLMRQLVPTGDEVANLLDDISNRAKLRNVVVAEISPQGAEDAGHFRASRYRFQVLGHYDDIGGFLSDIASLPRIMVPRNLTLSIASGNVASAVSDTTGSLLQAAFQLRTFVKPQGDMSGEEGDGGSR